MNKILIVLLSILSVTHAQRATLTLLQPRMYDQISNANSLCQVKDITNPQSPTLDNCPLGATCIADQLDPTKGRCTVFTVSEHQGTTGNDYTTSKVLNAETQLTSTAGAIACDLNDPNSPEKKWRCIEHAANLFLGDNEQISDYETDCKVVYKGDIGSEMSSGTLGSTGMDGAVLRDATSGTAFSSSASEKKISCHFVPQNNKYLGYAYAEVEFNKKASKVRIGEKAKKIIKIPMRFRPGNKANAGSVASDDGYPTDPDLTAAHELLSLPASSDGITDSTSDKGELHLDYKVNVMDSRYLIISQSGVEVLSQQAGNFDLIKEGLEISSTYQSFYDRDKNSFLNSGINAAAIAYSAYETGSCHKKGQSARGSLNTTGCDSTYYERDYAQYNLQGTYKALYGGMGHWKKEYIGCQICNNRLSIQGFTSQNGDSEIDIGIDIELSTLKSGCDGNTELCITLPTIFADAVTDKQLRLPNCDADGESNCGADGGYDPQHEKGHALGEFLVPKVFGTADYGDYDSEVEILSNARLKVSDNTKLLANASNSGLKISDDCETHGKVALNVLGNDMLAAANDLFFNKCRVIVKNVAFAKTSSIIYFTNNTGAGGCTTADCANAVYSEVVQVDGRRIIVGNVELSLLRRKTATVDKVGASITMGISKYTDVTSQVLTFDIVGTETMIGYDSSSQKTGDALDSETIFTTSAVNGEVVEHTIRSSSACTGFLDVQFRDQANVFAVYDLRLPCSRTTAATSDEISLTFDFTLGYDLVTNKVTAKGYYLSSLASADETGLQVGASDSGLSQNISVAVQYGYCDSANNIVREDEAGNSITTACAASSDANGKFTDQENSQHFLSDGLTLDAWSHCAQKVEDDNANDAYIVTTKIAMQYTRALTYDSGSGATMSTSKFCSDRKFVTTIKRDASATVTVATLRAPSLERAVAVTDISWNGADCSGADRFRLEITINATQKENNANWTEANLNRVLKPIVSGAEDSDNLMIEVGDMTAYTPSNQFKLVSSCITVEPADCEELCNTDGSGCTAQVNATTSSQSAWARLSHTETDIIMRGDFTNSDVDSDVNIVTKYVECPLDESNDSTGYLRAGATMQCDNEIKNATSTTVDSETNCAEAFVTDSGTAEVKLYITDNNSPTHLLTAAEHTAANTQNWNIRHSSIYIERYETNFNKKKGSLLSSEEFCECGDKTTDYDATVACVSKADRIFGLTPFGTLVCGKNTSNTFTYDQIRFDFLPLTQATNDLFEVKFVLLAENSDLDDINSRRRLRAVSKSVSLNRPKLGATAGTAASAGSFSVIVAEQNTADDALPANSDTTTTTTAAPHKHDLADGWITFGVIGGIVAVVGIIILLVMTAVRKGPAAVATIKNKLGRGGEQEGYERVQRFSNLRY